MSNISKKKKTKNTHRNNISSKYSKTTTEINKKTLTLQIGGKMPKIRSCLNFISELFESYFE